jgi:8-oxo-dGTP pyrophosphatase MutT (NUDIX family)
MDTRDATPLPAPGPQVIPRPAGHRPGSPAPWSGLPAAERRGITLHRVRTALAARPTGDGSAPWRVPGMALPSGGAAAVLIPLFDEGGEARVILTVRSDTLRSHRGEVAFPGGRLDGDEGVVAGALREAHEEAGIDPAAVTVVGTLSSLPTVSSNTLMTPVVGTLERRPAVAANPGEVERVFDVALADLVADGVFHEEYWLNPERNAALGIPVGEFPVWFFHVAGETVWGATARCLTELLCLALGVALPSFPRPPVPG